MPFSSGLGSRSRAGVVHGMRGGQSAAQRPDAGAGPRRPPEPSPAAPAGRGDSLRSRFLRRLRAALARAGRRSLPAALLLALALPAALLPLAVPAAAQEVVEVPRAWPLKPSGLSATQKEFRLLFVTSTGRNAASSRIADYNSFVQGRAAAGHSAIRSFSSKFRVVGSTEAVHARNNTSTTYTSSDKGVPIYWLNGDRVADDYEDFYDGSWDNKNGRGKNESGNGFSSSSWIWTGTDNDGTGSGNYLGISRVTRVRLSQGQTLESDDGQLLPNSNSYSLFALSPVIRVVDEVATLDVSIESSPTNATSGYAAGETIRVRLDFGEAVSVTDSPSVVLNIGRAVRRAVYASGSGTRHLDFEYPVQAGDFDSDGISLCSDTFLDRGCGRISLNGGSISAQSDSLAVELDLPALGNQSGHKVDATPDPMTAPMANPGTGFVPRGWALTPEGVGAGESFRLLFATPSRNATSADINDYNNHAINAAGTGHAAIRALKNGFRVIASTKAVDAKDNAGLTGTGVKIYWLGSDTKVADNYADLLDGTWDNESESPTDKNGNNVSAQFFWTGSNNNGTTGTTTTGNPEFPDLLTIYSVALGTNEGTPRTAFGALNSSTAGQDPLRAGLSAKTTNSPLYALSQVLMVPAALEFSASPEVVSRPGSGDTYRAGETIALLVPFTEPVRVLGAPSFGLTLGSTEVRARYVSGSGSDTLRFEYTVQRGDYDADGVSVELVDGESPFILDGAAIRAVADDEAVDLIADGTASVPGGAQHKVDGRVAQATAASISSSPASGSTYGAGETITVRLALNEAVLVTGRPHVLLNVGATRRQAVYVGPIGSATDALEFSYAVQAGDFDADGVALCAGGPGCGQIALDGGTIRAVFDEADALLRHPALAAQRGHRVDAAAPLPAPPTACSAEVTVPSDWALKPTGVASGGKFRMLFVTSNRRDARSTNIAHYNSFVQARAANGHAAIQNYGKGFRVLGSTQAVNARANTCSRSSDTDAAVYWLNGTKVADNYGDMYDGSWDSNADRLESGNSNTAVTSRVWTGTNNNGTTDSFNYLGGFSPAFGTSNSPTTPLKQGITTTGNYRLYGLSQVFVVDADRTTPATTDISIISNPGIGDTYRLGETVEVEVTYSEAVSVHGTPSVGLAVRSATEESDNEYDAAYGRTGAGGGRGPDARGAGARRRGRAGRRADRGAVPGSGRARQRRGTGGPAGRGGPARYAAAGRLAEGRDRPGGGAASQVPRGDAARPADRLVFRADGGDGRQGPGLALGPGRGHALRRPRGRSHAGRRGRDRHARRRLDGRALDRRADRLPQHRRGRVSPAQGPRPDHQPGLRRHQGGG